MSSSRRRGSPVSRYAREALVGLTFGLTFLAHALPQLARLVSDATSSRPRSRPSRCRRRRRGSARTARIAPGRRARSAGVCAETCTSESVTSKRIVRSAPSPPSTIITTSSSTPIRRSSESSTENPAMLPSAVAVRRAMRAIRLSAGKVNTIGPSTARSSRVGLGSSLCTVASGRGTSSDHTHGATAANSEQGEQTAQRRIVRHARATGGHWSRLERQGSGGER